MKVLSKGIARRVILATLGVGILVAIAITVIAYGNRIEIEIPSGYIGWVEIFYDISNCGASPDSERATKVLVSPDGKGCTRAQYDEGLRVVRYFYGNEHGKRIRELFSTGWGEGGEIWGEASPEGQFRFFVGQEEVFRSSYDEERRD